MIRLILLLLLLGGLVIFALQNITPVPLVILGTQTPAIPLSLWVLGAIAAGAFSILVMAAVTRSGRPPRRRFRPSSSFRNPIGNRASSSSQSARNAGWSSRATPEATRGHSGSTGKSDRPPPNRTRRDEDDWETDSRTSDDWDWDEQDTPATSPRYSFNPIFNRDKGNRERASERAYEERIEQDYSSHPPIYNDAEYRDSPPQDRRYHSADYSDREYQDRDYQDTAYDNRPYDDSTVYDAEYRDTTFQTNSAWAPADDEQSQTMIQDPDSEEEDEEKGLEEWENWEGYEESIPDEDTSERSRPPVRTEFEVKQEPKSGYRSGSIYSYTYRDTSEAETSSDTSTPSPDTPQEPRVITPPYRPHADSPHPPNQSEGKSAPSSARQSNDDDWGFEEEDD